MFTDFFILKSLSDYLRMCLRLRKGCEYLIEYKDVVREFSKALLKIDRISFRLFTRHVLTWLTTIVHLIANQNRRSEKGHNIYRDDCSPGNMIELPTTE